MSLEVINGSEVIKDEQSPLHGLVEFYRAFNSGDLSLMQQNWVCNEESVMSNPLGGVKRGWEEIQAVYERIFHGQAAVYVEYHDFSIQQSDTMFCAIGRERGYVEKQGQRLALAIRTTRFFTQQAGRWRQTHHHGSIDQPQLLQDYQGFVAIDAY